jgi:SAM-dependent methyltransferase
MARPFVAHYDLLYADKDYDKDIRDFLALTGLSTPIETPLLEIGAGTGNQTIRLARLAAQLACVEIDPDFAEILRAKVTPASHPHVRVVDAPIAALHGGNFAAAVAFFHVLNYIGRDAMPGFLADLAACLAPGADFVADIWHGEAALADPPRHEVRQKRNQDRDIRFEVSPRTDAAAREVVLDYAITIADDHAPVVIAERLELFLWPKAELTDLLTAAGFTDIAFFDYRNYPAPAAPESWRIWLHCRRAGRSDRMS